MYKTEYAKKWGLGCCYTHNLINAKGDGNHKGRVLARLHRDPIRVVVTVLHERRSKLSIPRNIIYHMGKQ
jgi:hypothetical protein